MKYRCSVEIAMARDTLVALFDDHANYKRWMPDLRSLERLADEPGAAGPRHRLVFRFGSRDFAMVETITRRELPERIDMDYDGPGSWNGVVNRFSALDAGRTRWDQDSEFRFDGLLMRLMSRLMPGRFRAQTLSYMTRFKEFAESQTDEGLERTRLER